MSVIQAALLGILQGVTEFLPVSSSGHLILARAMMEIQEIPVLFDVILHLATLVVVVWHFRQRVGEILSALWRLVSRKSQSEDRPILVLTLWLAGASLVTAVIGLGISRYPIRENPVMVAAFLLFTAVLLLGTLRARGSSGLTEIGWRRALLIGAAQGFGVFPGISRSGISIGTGLLAGLARKAAGEFSFLLSIPAVLGAFALSLKDAAELSSAVPLPSLAVGFLAALVAGYASLRLLLWLISDGKLWIFAIYLIPVGTWALLRFAA